jgi:hypothetical protein
VASKSDLEAIKVIAGLDHHLVTLHSAHGLKVSRATTFEIE